MIQSASSVDIISGGRKTAGETVSATIVPPIIRPSAGRHAGGIAGLCLLAERLLGPRGARRPSSLTLQRPVSNRPRRRDGTGQPDATSSIITALHETWIVDAPTDSRGTICLAF